MQYAVRLPLPIGLVRWGDPPSRYSVVVKATFDANDGRSPAPLSAEQQPLYTGELDGRGLVLEWSDFLRVKPCCDVVLHDATTSSARPVRVRVGSFEANVAPPLASMTRDGSCAPFEQRIAYPGSPLLVLLEHAGRRSIVTIPANPSAALLTKRIQRASPIMLRADTIYVHPWQARVSVVFRGTFQLTGDVDEDATLLVDPVGPISPTPQREIRLWHWAEAQEPSEYDPVFEAGAAPEELRPQSTLQMQAPTPAQLAQVADATTPLQPQVTLEMDAGPLAAMTPQETLTMPVVEGQLSSPGPTPTMQMPAVPGAPQAPPAAPPGASYAATRAPWPAGPPAPQPAFAPTFGPPPQGRPAPRGELLTEELIDDPSKGPERR